MSNEPKKHDTDRIEVPPGEFDSTKTDPAIFDPSKDQTSKFYDPHSNYKLTKQEKPSCLGQGQYKVVNKEDYTHQDISYILGNVLDLEGSVDFMVENLYDKDRTQRNLDYVILVLSEHEKIVKEWLPEDVYEAQVEPPQPGSSAQLNIDARYERKGGYPLIRTWVVAVGEMPERGECMFVLEPGIRMLRKPTE